MRTRVKICGITRSADAMAAVAAGADAIGLVFYAPSPRAVGIAQAREILQGLPPFVARVGLLVDMPRAEITRLLQQLPIDLLQFHGHERPEECNGFGRPWIKAVRMRDGIDLAAMERQYSGASALLLDAYEPGRPGGTGRSFDWERIPRALASRVILAGGLNPRNVESAIRRLRPYAVDVSGGVEQSKGIKDAEKIRAFIEGVKRGDNS